MASTSLRLTLSTLQSSSTTQVHFCLAPSPFGGGTVSEDGAGADKPDADVELAAPEILPRSKARPFDREPLIISRAPNASREGLCRLLKLALTL
eukprot:CAMPEP_0114144190 /NCGR_PEP_ID=MMETSP0043_2-20121206/19382_1 /TAXON_ID=464988 /ORGANISM="Hemiselmis andersenii, Strain CCMP644" /LENGTH=93 /DNA_ID=CAMNT_0001238527 /DNA_START=548 /DNA_END=829 /DNA_ORIENTATION=+